MPSENVPMPLSEVHFMRFQRFMLEETGINLPLSKLPLVESRLIRRVTELGLRGFGDYWKLVAAKNSPEERQYVINALSTNETYFYREHAHFEWLIRFARERYQPQQTFRVWSAGSSSGEEAYTIAIMLCEALGSEASFEIIASDISTRMLRLGKRGIYPRERVKKLPVHLIQRYFLWGREEYQNQLLVAPEIRKHVHFRHLNLTLCQHDAIGFFDVIFLRNVLIYFDTATKAQVLKNVSEKMREDGYLLLSHSETLNGLDCDLLPVRPSIYQKLDLP